MSKAVVDNRLMYVSPSGIDKFLECERKWVGHYVFGIKEEEDPNGASSTSLGTWAHTQMENAVLKGIEPGYDAEGNRLPPFPEAKKNVLIQSCELALSYLVEQFNFEPGKPPETLEVEQYIEKVTNYNIAGTRIHGRVDLADFSNPLRPRILDFKSCNGFGNALSSNPKVAKDKYLKNKPQVVIYVAYAFERCPDAEAVDIEYLYLNADAEGTPKIKPVQVSFTREESALALAGLEATVDRMQKAARITVLEEAEPEGHAKPLRAACKSFNKDCPLRVAGKCTQALFSTAPANEDDVTDFAEKLRARKAKQAGQAEPAKEGPPSFRPHSKHSVFTPEEYAEITGAVSDSPAKILRDLVDAWERAKAFVGGTK